MICPICERETRVVCTCGFCPNCIRDYGHDECSKILKEKQSKNDRTKLQS